MDYNRSAEKTRLAEIAGLLGASRTLRKVPQNFLEAHEMLLRGLPAAALTHLVESFESLRWDESFAKAVGMSLRTYQRHASTTAKPGNDKPISVRTSRDRKKKSAEKLLSQEQSGRTWKLAEILTKATAVFGTQQEAEQWLERAAIGLDQRRPIDLLATPAGAKIVEDFLDRLEFGVYA
ncbi:MAG TPA: antitoxin Xre/MbcA/ParS toxin-binding domain-containing protein [Xanthobacteraceae bacterium]|jgi:uncharacterized protein (DUF2384 family)